MNNMINLLKLQYTFIIALKKTLLIYLLAMLAFLSLTSNQDFALTFAAALVIMLLNYNSLAYEDKSKVDYLIRMLPVKSKEYILSKYLFCILNVFITMIFSDLVFLILNNFNIITSSEIDLSILNISIGIIGFFVVNILIPIAIIVGFNKARMVLIFLAVLPMCLSNIFIELSNYIKLIMPIRIMDIPVEFLQAGIIISAVFMTLISYFITANLYSKKDIH